MTTNDMKRAVGRPRSDGKPPLQRQEVLIVAGQLITRHGYAGTSLRMIANELGTSAPAILQRFGNKAELLNELVKMMADVSIAFHSAIESLSLVPDVRLYKMVESEVIALASADQAPISLFYLPELRQPEFKSAQQARSQMVNFYLDVIEEGMRVGVFHDSPSMVAAEQVFQLTETVIIAQDRARLGKPKQLARQTADFVLRGLLKKSNHINQIRAAANKVNIEMT